MADDDKKLPSTLADGSRAAALVTHAVGVGVPAIVVIAGLHGQPAALLALLGATLVVGAREVAGNAAAAKLHRLNDAVFTELRAVKSSIDLGASTHSEQVNALHEDVEKLRSGLEPVQVEQIALIVEETLRRSDEEWLELLRRAARGVVRQDVEASNRHAILAALRTLAPGHVRLLQRTEGGDNRLRVVPDHQGNRLTISDAERAALDTLASVGFISTQPADGSGKVFLSALGRQALLLLRPDPLPTSDAGAEKRADWPLP